MRYPVGGSKGAKGGVYTYSNDYDKCNTRFAGNERRKDLFFILRNIRNKSRAKLWKHPKNKCVEKCLKPVAWQNVFSFDDENIHGNLFGNQFLNSSFEGSKKWHCKSLSATLIFCIFFISLVNILRELSFPSRGLLPRKKFSSMKSCV